MHRLRRLPQLVTGAAEVHGEARFEHVAQLDEDYARFVAAELRESHVSEAACNTKCGGTSSGLAQFPAQCSTVSLHLTSALQPTGCERWGRWEGQGSAGEALMSRRGLQRCDVSEHGEY
eukprot:scaffold46337_cov62-Phaeocystis_antarctica.AAC.2